MRCWRVQSDTSVAVLFVTAASAPAYAVCTTSLIEEGLKRVGQVCIAVRDTQHTGTKKPLSFFDVSRRVEAHAGRFVPLPKISHVCHGRDLSYVVERIALHNATPAISATEKREKAGLVRRDGARFRPQQFVTKVRDTTFMLRIYHTCFLFTAADGEMIFFVSHSI